jgi:hypothetical protein
MNLKGQEVIPNTAERVWCALPPHSPDNTVRETP